MAFTDGTKIMEIPPKCGRIKKNSVCVHKKSEFKNILYFKKIWINRSISQNSHLDAAQITAFFMNNSSKFSHHVCCSFCVVSTRTIGIFLCFVQLLRYVRRFVPKIERFTYTLVDGFFQVRSDDWDL
jgi:hypothetical protein